MQHPSEVDGFTVPVSLWDYMVQFDVQTIQFCEYALEE